MHISGSNLNNYIKLDNTTYHFSKYPLSWGWATWKRAWTEYDFELKDTKLYNKYIERAFRDPFERRYWKTVLKSANNIDTWDYQWIFAIWRANGLCINTNYNFVLNKGFDENATHTTYANPYVDLKTEAVTSIIHPQKIERSKKGEIAFLNKGYNLKRSGYLKYFLVRGGNLIHKVKSLLKF